MPLVDAILHLLLRLVKFAGLLLRFHLANNLLKNFHRSKTAFAFKTFDVQFNFAGLTNGDFKFALGHKLIIGLFCQQSGNFFFEMDRITLGLARGVCPHVVEAQVACFIHK